MTCPCHHAATTLLDKTYISVLRLNSLKLNGKKIGGKFLPEVRHAAWCKVFSSGALSSVQVNVNANQGPLKPFFSSPISKSREVYTPKTSCMKKTSVYFEKRAPDVMSELKLPYSAEILP